MRPFGVSQTLLSAGLAAVLGLIPLNTARVFASDTSTPSAESTRPYLGEYVAPEGKAAADAYAKALAVQLQAQAAQRGVALKDMQVYLHHQGETIPPEINWVATTLGHYGVGVEITRWHKAIEDMSAEKLARIDEQKAKSELWIEFSKDPNLPQWSDKHLFYSMMDKVGLGFRHFFKLPRGFWVLATPYFDRHTGVRRPFTEQAKDLFWYSVLSVVTGGAAAWEISNRFGTDPTICAGAAITTAVLTRIILGYLHRANTAFFNQGKHYRHDLGGMSTTIRWSLSGMFVHSFTSSSIFQLVLHGGEVNGDIIAKTAWQGLLGAFAKVLPNRYLGRWEETVKHMDEGTRRRVSAANLIFAHLVVNGFLECLKFGTLVGNFDYKYYAYVALAVIGVGDLVWEHFTKKRRGNSWADYRRAIAKRMRKDWYAIRNSIGLTAQTQFDDVFERITNEVEQADPPVEFEGADPEAGSPLRQIPLGRTQIYLSFPGCAAEVAGLSGT